MKRRALAGMGATVGSLTAATALLIGAVSGHASPSPSEAYGAFITGVIDPPQPHVQSTDGTEQSDTLAELPDNPLLDLRAATVTAGDGHASVELANVEIVPSGGLPPELEEALQPLLDPVESGVTQLCAEDPTQDLSGELPGELDPLTEQLSSQQLCDVAEGGTPALLSADLITVACEGDSGTFEIANLRLLGQEIEIPGPDANTEIPLDPLVNITFNKQFSDDDGFTTQAMAVELAEGEFEVVLASATCGTAQDEPEEPMAPKPTPVETQLPVTG
ncbi:hypothetical protein H0B56_09505 [Haloechinothrix sp. YIM 98757]|uniref:Uncharacterized protein n=1 Tax=Haloechinothrix aidingensis TaxID=2752311 RepID=A0A838A8M5_9PSEU|nr:choice-of-anchor P family protein [Haloechinothrix aidingensis]MBA0125775.1 hypothetical protein [Haloechinothrix aidingensis]